MLKARNPSITLQKSLLSFVAHLVTQNSHFWSSISLSITSSCLLHCSVWAKPSSRLPRVSPTVPSVKPLASSMSRCFIHLSHLPGFWRENLIPQKKISSDLPWFSHSIVLHKLCSWTARLSLICPSFPASFLSPYSVLSSLTLTLNTERSIVAHAHLGQQCYSPHCLLSSLQNSFQLTSHLRKLPGHPPLLSQDNIPFLCVCFILSQHWSITFN